MNRYDMAERLQALLEQAEEEIETRDIEGYEGLYAVTADGRVWSYRNQKFLKPISNKAGYLQVVLYKSGKRKAYYLHRLTSEAFIPNPLGLPQVNHKDENPSHNWISNLEWCDAKYNTNYGTRTQRIAQALSKPILCVETGQVFCSAHEVERVMGLDNGSIIKCCKGKQKTCGGCHWEYVKPEAAKN